MTIGPTFFSKQSGRTLGNTTFLFCAHTLSTVHLSHLLSQSLVIDLSLIGVGLRPPFLSAHDFLYSHDTIRLLARSSANNRHYYAHDRIIHTITPKQTRAGYAADHDFDICHPHGD